MHQKPLHIFNSCHKKVILWSQKLLISNSSNHNFSTDLQFVIFFNYPSNCCWVFYIFALLKRFSGEKTYGLCHLTKMKMVTTKTVLLSIFWVIYLSLHNIVPILTKIFKKNYCFWIKTEFIKLTFTQKREKSNHKLCTLNPRYLSTLIAQN